MSNNIQYISSNDFEQEVLFAGNVVVDFYSTECPPCEALAAKYEPLSEIYKGDIKFIKIMRQENRQLAESLGVRSSPTVLFYKNGKQLDKAMTGAVKRKDLTSVFDSMLSLERVREIQATLTPTVTECDVLVLGGGPAGLSASIYTAQANLHTILVDNAMPGGQVSTLHQVSNYPGFIDAQPGYMLMHNMSEQAKKAGVEYRVSVDVTRVDLHTKEIIIDNIEAIRAKKIVIATGSSPKPLNVPGEKEYAGNGISYCATCDAKYYEGKHVVVIGGKDTALEETLFISKFASKITMIHSGSAFSSKKELQDKIFAQEKITVLFGIKLKEFRKSDKDEMIIIGETIKENEPIEILGDGIFVFTGMRPKLIGKDEQLKQDDKGYLLVDDYMRSNIPDVFAVGDVISKPYRQITIATAEGTIAAMTIAKELG